MKNWWRGKVLFIFISLYWFWLYRFPCKCTYDNLKTTPFWSKTVCLGQRNLLHSIFSTRASLTLLDLRLWASECHLIFSLLPNIKKIIVWKFLLGKIFFIRFQGIILYCKFGSSAKQDRNSVETLPNWKIRVIHTISLRYETIKCLQWCKHWIKK